MELNRRQLIERLGKAMAGLASASTIGALLSACDKSENSNIELTKQPGRENKPNFFSPHQRQTVKQLSKIIIPKTDTPGAIDAGVPDFIEAILQDIFSQEDQVKFNDGLFSLDLLSSRLNENNFSDLPLAKQEKLANHLNFAAIKDEGTQRVLIEKSQIDKKVLDSALHYFSVIKELTIFGYYTSEVGASQVLHYNPIPGKFNGCVPLEEIGKTWATPK